MTARAAALLAIGALAAGATPVGRIDVRIDQVRSTRGLIRVCITADPDNFPACVNDAHAIKRNVSATVRAVRFDALPQGRYAIALIHDENGNHRLDKLAGIPREGYGFSRNPPVSFGPPSFSAARFDLAGDATVQQVRMRYIF